MKALIKLSPDLTTKARATRQRFTRLVVENLRRGLQAASIPGKVRASYSRLHLESDDPLALAIAQRTFGVWAIAPCHEVETIDFDAIVALGVDLFAKRIAGRTFAVRARVRDDRATYTSQEMNVRLGAALAPFGKVKLENPDVTVSIEVRDGGTWLYTDALKGPGGLPLGAGGRAVVLLSGGFDSAVAAYTLMRRGVVPDFVCLRLGGDAHERAALAVANQLSARFAPGQRIRFVSVPFEESVERMQRVTEPKLWQLVLKRMMYRVAQEVAHRTQADAIVTGEALGQVSSQTLPNLRALEAPLDLPVLRPLVTFDKPSIVELARAIGSFELCARVPEYCALAAKKPATKIRAFQLDEAEVPLAFDERRTLDDATWLPLPARRPDAGDPTVTEVPEGAVLLDLRSASQQREHALGGLEVDPLAILERPEQLDARSTYVVLCDVGTRSAWFVRQLRELGFDAYAFVPASSERTPLNADQV